MQYKNPTGGQASSMGTQFRTDLFYAKALTEAAKEQYFSQKADVRAMPKNMGKAIKQYHYMPVLDDRNINDQGLDAAGAVIADGNLYGSSKDVGTISSKLPTLSENGGRVNRVGFTRLDLEGTIQKYGFFDEYTAESMNFDTDAELEMHITREMIFAANEINEDLIQIDLLNAADVIRFPNAVAAVNQMTGEGTASVVDYEDFMRLAIDLYNNRCPKHTTIVKGSRMTDTKTINDALYMHIGSELLPTIKKMTDTFGNPAFVAARHYADATEIAVGEIGAIGDFRIILVPEMMNWAGAGAAVGTNPGYRATGGNYDVFPLLVVGDQSFTTIGFQTDGKQVKFKIKHVKPESDSAYSSQDPFGEKGYMSIKWYYGFMALRPERIALMYSVAEI